MNGAGLAIERLVAGQRRDCVPYPFAAVQNTASVFGSTPPTQ